MASLVTERLILVALPSLLASPRYSTFYASLLSSPLFCQTAFGTPFSTFLPSANLSTGPHYPARPYTSSEIAAIFSRKVASTWSLRSFGDFGLALRPVSFPAPASGKWEETLEAVEVEELEWVGYVTIRDATTSSLPRERAQREAATGVPETIPTYPAWEEMVEIKYGLAPAFWGKGYVPEGTRAVQEWGVERFGVRRFIGTTEVENVRSAGVLKKLGYVEKEVSSSWSETRGRS